MRNRRQLNVNGLVWVTLWMCGGHAIALPQTVEFDRQWPQWRGPHANGVASAATPPVEWSETSHVAWKVPIVGEGISTPIVWNGRIFLLTAVPTDRTVNPPPSGDPRAMTQPPQNFFQFKVICLDLQDGHTIWEDLCVERVPHEGRHETSTYAAASPVTDGKRLIVPFGSFGIFCYSLDGVQQWSVDLGDMHTRRGWGEATSPVLVGDRVIMNWDNEDQSSMFALHADTGETLWQVPRDEPTTWATPLVIRRGGSLQIVTNGTNAISGYDLQSGQLLWSSSGTTLNAIPCPVEFADNVICMAGYRGNRVVSLKIADDGEPLVNWERDKGTPYVPSPLLSQNRLYFTQSNKAILHCLNAETGEYFYPPQRLPGLENLYGSPVAASGHVYLADRSGNTLVLRDAETFAVVATNRLDDQFDASPVPVGNRLLLRGKRHLYCIAK